MSNEKTVEFVKTKVLSILEKVNTEINNDRSFNSESELNFFGELERITESVAWARCELEDVFDDEITEEEGLQSCQEKLLDVITKTVFAYLKIGQRLDALNNTKTKEGGN